MDKVQSRVQNAITEMMTSLENEYIRKMQAKMYRCSAACCENPNYRADDVNRCLEKCTMPVEQSKAVLENELSGYQNRLSRCAMECQDKARDNITSNSSEADIAKHRSGMEQCVVQCADTHIALIPAMMKRMQSVLKQNSQNM